MTDDGAFVKKAKGKWRKVSEHSRKRATGLDEHPQIERVGSVEKVYDCDK